MRGNALRMTWLMAAALGCSDGAAGFQSSVPGQASLAQLSPDQVRTLCEEQVVYDCAVQVSTAARARVCWLAGRKAALGLLFAQDPVARADADLRKACQTAWDSCAVQTTPACTNASQAAASRCASTIMPTSDCTATVDQYAACVNALEAPLTAPAPSCASVTAAWLMAPTDPLPATAPPAGCQALRAACPELTQPFLDAAPLRSS
jgi:hypothetical protein